MLSALILARDFSPKEFASYSYFQLTVSMVAAYSTMGFGVAAAKIFAEFNQSASPNRMGLLWWMSSAGSIFFAVAVLVVPQSWIGTDFPIPRWLFSCGVLAFSLNIVPSNAIIGLEKYREAALMSALSGGFMIFGSIWFSKSNDSIAAIGVLIGSIILHGIGQSVVILRAVTLRNILSQIIPPRSADLKHIFDLSLPMLAVTLLAASGTWILGRFILAMPEEGHGLFSIYAVGLQWFAFALLLPGILSKVLLPRFVRLNAAGAKIESKKLVRSSALISLAIALLVLFFGFLFSRSIGRMYNFSVDVSEYFLLAYLAVAVLVAPINVIGSSFVANGLHRYWLVLTSGWFILLLLCGFTLQHSKSYMGPLSLGISYAGFALAAYLVARRKNLI